MRVQQTPFLPAAIALAIALGLAACDNPKGERSVGQKIDSTIAKVEQKSDQAANAVKKDVDAARASAGQALDATAIKFKDAAITTSINAELARDASLSALKINVDTSEGHVVLHGTAPDVTARERATGLARHVEGVLSVDNQLQVHG